MAVRTPRVLTLSAEESLILELLVHQQEMYGLQLVAASRRRLKRGTVYVTLGRMEEKGYITSRLEDAPPQAGGLPRRVYEATPLRATGADALDRGWPGADAGVRAMRRARRSLARVRRALVQPDTMTRVIDPLIADLQLEHEEAAHAGRRWKARLVDRSRRLDSRSSRSSPYACLGTAWWCAQGKSGDALLASARGPSADSD